MLIIAKDCFTIMVNVIPPISLVCVDLVDIVKTSFPAAAQWRILWRISVKLCDMLIIVQDCFTITVDVIPSTRYMSEGLVVCMKTFIPAAAQWKILWRISIKLCDMLMSMQDYFTLMVNIIPSTQ